MKYIQYTIFSILIFWSASVVAQNTTVEGYAYESGNRGYLAVVQVTAIDHNTKEVYGEVFTDKDGFYSLEVPAGKLIDLEVIKDMFESKVLEIKPLAGQKNFTQFEMQRTPGYVFEITLAEKRDDVNTPVNAIKDTRIEVYNNTTQKEEMVLEHYQYPEFRVNLLKGNHYTILIRKEGFLAKRMEAFVNVNGCILCFEGIGTVNPGVAENMTEGNNNGVLLANVEMERVFTGKKMEIQNIYYDLDKWDIKQRAKVELNKVVQLMKDNPKLTLELGSHTDSRGTTEYNQNLSEKRAASAVKYLSKSGGVRPGSIVSKGYGESQITNKCVDGVACTENEHAVNRRTELKITGFYTDSRFKSLAQMKKEEEIEAEILAGSMDNDQIELLPGEDLEDAIARTKKEKEEKGKILNSKIKSSDIESASEIKDGAYEKADTKEIVKHMNTTTSHSVNDGHDHGHDGHDHHIQSDSTKAINNGARSVKMGGLNIDAPKLSDEATGIMISIYSGEERLPMTHKAFKVFPNIRLFHSDTGMKMYIIERAYDTISEAEAYLKDTIIVDYPSASVVVFQNGKITN